jgi:hypothetical protein
MQVIRAPVAAPEAKAHAVRWRVRCSVNASSDWLIV